MRSLWFLYFYMLVVLTLCIDLYVHTAYPADIKTACVTAIQKADQVISDCTEVVNLQTEMIEAQAEVIQGLDDIILEKDAEIERKDEPETKWIFGLSGSTLTMLLLLLL